MFRFLRAVLWTGCAVGFGIFLATVELQGKTPLEHLRLAWQERVDTGEVDALKADLQDALDHAKDQLSGERKPRPERYSDDEREAIDRIIARGPTKG